MRDFRRPAKPIATDSSDADRIRNPFDVLDVASHQMSATL